MPGIGYTFRVDHMFPNGLCILEFDLPTIPKLEDDDFRLELRKVELDRIFELCVGRFDIYDICQIYFLSVPCQTLISKMLIFYKFFCQKHGGKLEIFCKTSEVFDNLSKSKLDCLLGEDAIKLM